MVQWISCAQYKSIKAQYLLVLGLNRVDSLYGVQLVMCLLSTKIVTIGLTQVAFLHAPEHLIVHFQTIAHFKLFL